MVTRRSDWGPGFPDVASPSVTLRDQIIAMPWDSPPANRGTRQAMKPAPAPSRKPLLPAADGSLARALYASAMSSKPRTGIETLGRLAQVWGAKHMVDKQRRQKHDLEQQQLAGLAEAMQSGDPAMALVKSGNMDLAMLGARGMIAKQNQVAPNLVYKDIQIDQGHKRTAAIDPKTGSIVSFLGEPIPGDDGISVSMSPDGTTKVNIGGPTPAMKTKNQEGVDSLYKQQFDLLRVAEAFDPESLTIPGQMRQGTIKFLDRLGIKQDRESIDAAIRGTKLRRATMAQINNYIKAMSGVAVSAQEAKRLEAVFPTMDDGPEFFRTKLEDALQVTELLLDYAMTKPGSVMSVDHAVAIVNQRKQAREAVGGTEEVLKKWEQ